MSLGEQQGQRRERRRRTAFEQDCRELGIKIFVGALLGGIIWAVFGNVHILVALAIGEFLIFWLAGSIKDHGKHAD